MKRLGYGFGLWVVCLALGCTRTENFYRVSDDAAPVVAPAPTAAAASPLPTAQLLPPLPPLPVQVGLPAIPIPPAIHAGLPSAPGFPGHVALPSAPSIPVSAPLPGPGAPPPFPVHAGLPEGPAYPVHADPLPLTPLPSPRPSPAPVVSGSIFGHVTNALNGWPLGGVAIHVHPAASSATVASTMTDWLGGYTIPGLAAGKYSLDYTLTGFNPLLGVAVTVLPAQAAEANEALTPDLPSGEYRMVLTWTSFKLGAVTDVDSYLAVPGDADPVFWHNQYGTGANLDHDQILWSGPETITITDLKPVGTYIYYVDNYSNRNFPDALGNSSVHVVVYHGNQIVKQYDVPPGVGLIWEAFRIVDGVFDDSQSQRYNDSLWHAPY